LQLGMELTEWEPIGRGGYQKKEREMWKSAGGGAQDKETTELVEKNRPTALRGERNKGGKG